MTTHTHVFQETPVGLINGSNKVFTVAYAFQAGTLEVYLNGVEQIKNTDYVESSGLGFAMTNAPLSTPIPADELWVNYIKSA